MTEEQKNIKRLEVKEATSRIRSLKAELFKSIDEEHYERAAILRDQVRYKQVKLISMLSSL